jgi:two-component system sensor histidine kinase KdpD
MNSRRTLVVTRWLLATCALAGIVLVYQRWLHVNPTTVALSLLLLVLVLAAQWGLRYAVVISIASAACYNFFFLPPFGTFTIADTQNWLALLAFLTTSIIASRLSQRVRDEADDARARQRELDTLFRLGRELLQSESVASLLSSLPATVVGITSARSGYLYLIEGNRLYQTGGASVSEVEIPHLATLSGSLTSTQREGDELQIPLRSGVRPKGILVLRQPQLSNETAGGIASLISLALDRAHALENLARGEAAKENERLRTLMIDSITHELRTPLTSIKGAASTLLSVGASGEDAHELLTIIDEESDRLNQLVSEAVEMSQLDTQQVQMHMKAESVRGLIEEASEACGSVKSQHFLKIDVPEVLRVVVDPVFFQKVICNLLENSAKYSEPGTPITVSAEAANGRVLISVADRGIGIDAWEQGLVFERFYRARSQASGTSGTGMGLAISRAIIHAHGGEITVTSQPGRGSVFTISLPNPDI